MGCLFCGFINGDVREHKRGYPFLINHETKNTVSFLSLDSPVNRAAHMLVIPKVHYKSFHQIPKKIREELLEHLALVCRFYSSKGMAYNLLLNNGKAAGQYVPHSHFHVIPRKSGDGINIEVWKRTNISKEDFTDLSKNTHHEFKKFLKST